MKKTVSLILIIVGLAVGIYGLTGHVDKKKLVEIGDVSISKNLEIQKDKNTLLNWVSVSGGALLLIGVVLIATSRKS